MDRFPLPWICARALLYGRGGANGPRVLLQGAAAPTVDKIAVPDAPRSKLPLATTS